jgi:hypothetical protein
MQGPDRQDLQDYTGLTRLKTKFPENNPVNPEKSC